MTPFWKGFGYTLIQSRIRRHVCVLFITKRTLYGASGAGRPKNGASRLRSYLEKEAAYLRTIRILHESSTFAGHDGTQHKREPGLSRGPSTEKWLPIRKK